jgi:hypothetical protein
LSYTYTNIHANSHPDADGDPDTHTNAERNAECNPANVGLIRGLARRRTALHRRGHR